MKLTVRYYALLREDCGKTSEEKDLDVVTANDLFERLRTEYGWPYPQARIRVAVNDAFCDWATALHEGDTVSLIPPVAGG